MKQSMTLEQMKATSQKLEDGKKDFLCPLKFLRAEFTKENKVKVVMKNYQNNGVNSLILSPTIDAHRQLAQAVDIGQYTYMKLLEEQPYDLVSIINSRLRYQLDNRPEKKNCFMVRTIDEQLRAIRSDQYFPVSNKEIIDNCLDELSDYQMELGSCHIDHNKFWGKMIFPKMEMEVEKGDLVQFGIAFGNNEIGQGPAWSYVMGYRKVCTNGLILPQVESRFKRNHKGNRKFVQVPTLYNKSEFYLQEKIKREAVFESIRQSVSALVHSDDFKIMIERMREAARTTIQTDTLEKLMETLQKKHNFTEWEMNHINSELEKSKGKVTHWDLVNAVTNTGNEAPTYDRATELELIGGELLMNLAA